MLVVCLAADSYLFYRMLLGGPFEVLCLISLSLQFGWVTLSLPWVGIVICV